MTSTTTTRGRSAADFAAMRATADSLRSPAERFAAMRATADSLRVDPMPLTEFEMSQLDVIALGYERHQARLAERAALVGEAREAARQAAVLLDRGERALVASMGSPGAAVVPWEGTLGMEGQMTGDGRLIASDALTWETPVPLRWSPVDWGGHDGAVLVGRIESIERRPGGVVWGSGVIDLGSPQGAEAARLIGSGLLSGVSFDLDSVDSASAEVRLAGGETAPASVTAAARIRAATLVAIPAFAEAKIALSSQPEPVEVLRGATPGHGDDCGCSSEGARSLILSGPTPDTFPDTGQPPATRTRQENAR